MREEGGREEGGRREGGGGRRQGGREGGMEEGERRVLGERERGRMLGEMEEGEGRMEEGGREGARRGWEVGGVKKEEEGNGSSITQYVLSLKYIFIVCIIPPHTLNLHHVCVFANTVLYMYVYIFCGTNYCSMATRGIAV